MSAAAAATDRKEAVVVFDLLKNKKNDLKIQNNNKQQNGE